MIKKIEIRRGDITKMKVGAIVNAAKPSLLGGEGVDGAIHAAAGPKLLEECRKVGAIQPGQAVITNGYELSAKHVIHTPGPIYQNGKHGERDILTWCWMNSIKLADDNHISSLAFPSIATGIYGYPLDEAASIAVSTVFHQLELPKLKVKEVFIVCFDECTYQAYQNALISVFVSVQEKNKEHIGKYQLLMTGASASILITKDDNAEEHGVVSENRLSVPSIKTYCEFLKHIPQNMIDIAVTRSYLPEESIETILDVTEKILELNQMYGSQNFTPQCFLEWLSNEYLEMHTIQEFLKSETTYLGKYILH